MKSCVRIMLAALMVFALATACKKEEAKPYGTPDATVKAYAAAMKAGDFDKALECYADTALSETSLGVAGLSKEDIRNLFIKSLAQSQEPYAKNDPAKMEVKMLTAEVTYELGGSKHTHTLVNQDGEWKIATDLTSK